MKHDSVQKSDCESDVFQPKVKSDWCAPSERVRDRLLTEEKGSE